MDVSAGNMGTWIICRHPRPEPSGSVFLWSGAELKGIHNNFRWLNLKALWWDQMPTVMPDWRIYNLIWTHKYDTSEDLNNRWVLSQDNGKIWSVPVPTNLRGQVCTPIPLQDGRAVSIYNYRYEPEWIYLAITEDLTNYDIRNKIVLFDASA